MHESPLADGEEAAHNQFRAKAPGGRGDRLSRTTNRRTGARLTQSTKTSISSSGTNPMRWLFLQPITGPEMSASRMFPTDTASAELGR